MITMNDTNWIARSSEHFGEPEKIEVNVSKEARYEWIASTLKHVNYVKNQFKE